MIFSGGLPETLCGPGSTMEATANVRAWLPWILYRLGVKRLLDAPCGDRNWIATVTLPCAYVGVDFQARHMERARRDGAEVIQADIRSELLPQCDAILSRDFFQHLEDEDAVKALTNMRRTGAKHLLATCHRVPANGPLVADRNGLFRPVNMSLPPFDLGESIDSVEDGQDGRILGVWVL